MVRPSTVVGAIGLAIVSSGAYDLLVKPGLTSFGHGMLSVFTLGSRTLRDSVFVSAAADPTGVSGLLLVLIVYLGGALAMVFGAVTMFRNPDSWKVSLRKTFLKAKEADPQLTPEAFIEAHSGKNERVRNRLRIVYLICTLLYVVAASIAFGMQNEAVVIWRKFNQNVTILGAAVPPAELSALRAQFASMHTEDDFDRLSTKMQAVAASAGVKLDSLTNW